MPNKMKVDKRVIEKVWNYLVDLASKKETKSYTEITADLFLWNPQVVWKLLSPIQDYCLGRKLPHITALIIKKGTTEQGDGYIPDYTKTPEETILEVYNYNWNDENFIDSLYSHD